MGGTVIAMSPADPDRAAGRPFGRVLTAMVTPFDADGRLDLDRAEELADHLVGWATTGWWSTAPPARGPPPTDQEKAELVRAVVGAVGDRATVVAGAGTYDTAHSVQLARDGREGGRARPAGRHAVLLAAAAVRAARCTSPRSPTPPTCR